MNSDLTLCRVTVNVQGAVAGSHVLADLTDPGIASMVKAGILVPDLGADVSAPPEAAESPVELESESAPELDLEPDDLTAP